MFSCVGLEKVTKITWPAVSEWAAVIFIANYELINSLLQRLVNKKKLEIRHKYFPLIFKRRKRIFCQDLNVLYEYINFLRRCQGH